MFRRDRRLLAEPCHFMEHTSPDGGTDLHSFDDAAQSAGMLYGLFESHSLSGYSMQFYTGSRIYFTAFCRVRAFDLPLTPLLGGDFKILDSVRVSRIRFYSGIFFTS